MTEMKAAKIRSIIRDVFALYAPDVPKPKESFIERLAKEIEKESALDEEKMKEMEDAIRFHRKEGQGLAHACHDLALKLDNFRTFLRKLDTATDNYRTALITDYFENNFNNEKNDGKKEISSEN